MNGPYEAVSLDPYAVLGVATNAEFDVLKTAYRRLVRENHPDIAHDKGLATRRMAQINAAWQLIGEPGKRAAFDARQRFEARERERVRETTATPKPTPASNTARPAPRPTATSYTPPRSAANTNRGSEKREAAAGTHPRHEARKAAPKPKNEASKIPSATAARTQRPVSGNSKTRGSQRLAQASRLVYLEAKPAEAIDLCRSVIRSDFRNVPARELMGEALLRLGQNERAAAIWEQALILQPNNIALHKRWKTLRERMAKTQGNAAPQSGGQPKAQSAASDSSAPGSTNIPPKTSAPSSGQANAQAKSPQPIPTIHAVVRPKVAEKREQPSLLRRLSARLLRR